MEEPLTIRINELLDSLEIVQPSWGLGNSGTRFHVFRQSGVARDVFEKIADAGLVHRLTGTAGRISFILPWDADDTDRIRGKCADEGLAVGPIRTNLFQDNDYRLGTLCNPDVRVRAKAVAHIDECARFALQLGSAGVGIWLPDGTNYPGQDSLRMRRHRLVESLNAIELSVPEELSLLLEYKLFEPAFYHTDVPDWGTAEHLCGLLGERGKVIVDLGHHAPGTNIEFILMSLLDRGRLGALDLNSRFYADDDLMVGSADPFQLFRVMYQLVDNWEMVRSVVLGLDECHNIEEKVPATIRSVLNVQEALAKAALVDETALGAAQEAGDVLGAYELFIGAYNADVRGVVADWREAHGFARDPQSAYRASGHAERTGAERGAAGDRGWLEL